MVPSIEPTSTPSHPPQRSWFHTAFHEGLAEAFGTFILIVIGNGTGGGKLAGSIVDDWQAGMVWAIGIVCGIYSCGFVSGAHLNPAISVGMAVGGYMPLWKLPHYFIGQLCGALIGSTVVYSFYKGLLNHDLNTFAQGSLEVAYLRNSGVFSCKLHPTVGPVRGVYIEAMITGLLVVVVSYIGDPHSILQHYPFVPPFVIASFVAGIIACFGPLTSACLNPARDFGPRLTTFIFGWGSSAIPGNARNPFWVFIVGPLIGGVLGALAWRVLGSRLYTYAAEQRALHEENSAQTGDGNDLIDKYAANM